MSSQFVSLDIDINKDIYKELTQLARSILSKGRRYDTMDTSAVVNESLIKFYNKQTHSFASQGHFYALMAKIMRGLIIDYARAKQSQIRGGHLQKVTMTQISSETPQEMSLSELLDLDEAIDLLTQEDPKLAQVLTMKFYAGLTNKELADSFQTSESTIKRELRVARAFVKAQLKEYSSL